MPLKVFRRQQITARIRKKSHKSHACVLACSLSKQWLNIYIWKGQKLQDTPKTFTKNHRNSHLQWSYTVHGIPWFLISEGKKTGFFFMEYSNPSTDNSFNWRDFSAFCFKTTVRKLSEEKKKKKPTTTEEWETSRRQYCSRLHWSEHSSASGSWTEQHSDECPCNTKMHPTIVLTTLCETGRWSHQPHEQAHSRSAPLQAWRWMAGDKPSLGHRQAHAGTSPVCPLCKPRGSHAIRGKWAGQQQIQP